jgi:hypothetical protein
VWLYIRTPRGYLETRRALVMTSAAAMVIHVVYPLAPPRMLPGLGFIDTGNTFGPATYGTKGFFDSVANQIAAMPSLHFGWAILVAVAVIRYGRWRVRWLVVLHPALTLLVIVVTANHYWLDGIVAALLVVLSFGVLALLQRRTDAHATVLDLTTGAHAALPFGGPTGHHPERSGDAEHLVLSASGAGAASGDPAVANRSPAH